ncbi:MAG: ammonium transporter [Deltaproteobacteria bacterium]|nr:ammonium transporter [Deltaproteobacteria bacterium]MBU53643.1 ammonium transporter [Deltaproteobacteria bacterium]|tara:strand:- start:905 stop:2257 length:1353 start_codon:yes stop_codon:yes gene_type:complete
MEEKVKQLKWLRSTFVCLLFCCMCYPEVALAASGNVKVNALNTFWVLLAAFMVFLMQAGFGMVEAGLIRAKNAANILMKNMMDFCMASLGFFAFGYAIMFGGDGALFGTTGWFLIGAKSPAGVDVPMYAFWLFQAVFCGAAATIVAGGMAGRMKFAAYLMYSFVISAIIYPIVGHWVWGGGWLASLNFHDFAGSTVVHATGGFAALIGTIVLGPRIGKFRLDGSASFIAGHNIPLVALGVFLLWFGWFGFNPGSTLGFSDPEQVARIAINTNLAAAMGSVTAMLTAWAKFGKPDLGFTLNGALAGLVAITAPCSVVTPGSAIYIGAIGGLLCVYGVSWLDKLQIDDPVGAAPVHGFNGLWGTLAVGLFGQKALGSPTDGLFFGGGFKQLGIQFLGAIAVIAFVIISMWIVFKAIDASVGLRVSEQEELQGLDLSEHGMESYSGFQIFTTE